MPLSSDFRIRSLILFAAASTALLVAWLVGIENPFWAAMPVWVVMQDYREDLVIRGVLRIVGTLVGSGIALAILLWTDNTMIEALAVGATVGIGVAAAYIIGTIYSYGALIMAITVAVVVLPGLDHPIDETAFAISRILCTLIGVLSITLFSFALLPKREGPPPEQQKAGWRQVALRGGIAALSGFAAAWIVSLLGGVAGISAGLSITVFASLIGSMRNNAPVLDNLVPGALIGIVAAILYRAIASYADIEGMYLVLLAVVFIAFGAVLRSHRKTAPLGLDANMCFLLAAEAGAQGHTLVQHAIGAGMLVVAAVVMTMLYRGRGHLRVLPFLSA